MANARKWFTADTHFGADARDILVREMRPFRDPGEYMREQVRIWNAQAGKDDLIYVIGDFCNYNAQEKDYASGIAVSREVRARIILITGNAEERVIKEHFGGDFAAFREYCLSAGRFEDVRRNDYAECCGRVFFLTHRPADHAPLGLTLFGHTHRGSGLWKPFGLNMGTDLNHFRLFGEEDLINLLEQKEQWWDRDPDMNCL